MKATMSQMPSPRGSNRENLWILRLPRGVDPKGALDAAAKFGGPKIGDDAPDLGKLRAKLENFLVQVLSDDELRLATDLLDECLPSQHSEYDRAADENADEDDDDRDGMPRTAVTGDKRGARDRRQMAADAAFDSFAKMFPEIARIKIG